MNLQELHTAVRQELTQNILPFYIKHGRDWQNGGFYGHINNDNSVEPDAPKGTVQCARLLWSFSQAYRVLGDEMYERMAVQAFDYLRRYLWDHQHGGLRWSVTARNAPLDENKLIYAQAFGIYGLSEFYLATGNETALALALRIYRRLESYGRDGQHGGYWESCAADWTRNDIPVDDTNYPVAKSMNTNLHVLEAYTNLYRANPSGDLHQALYDLIKVMCEHIINHKIGHMWLHFEADWRPINGHVSYGHDIEASWLLIEAAEVVADPALLQQCQATAQQMASTVLDQAIQTDGSLQNEPLDDHREWWPQAEALVGFVNAYQLSGEGRYLEAAVNCWRYIDAHMIDHEQGEWFWAVTAAGTPQERVKSGMWKTPYHNGRACLELIQRIKVEEHVPLRV